MIISPIDQNSQLPVKYKADNIKPRKSKRAKRRAKPYKKIRVPPKLNVDSRTQEWHHAWLKQKNGKKEWSVARSPGNWLKSRAVDS